jgi:hypothetical protein
MITNFNEYIKESNSNSQFFKTYEKTKEVLDYLDIKNYTIKDDLTVDVDGDVYIINVGLEYIPVKFGIVKGNFNCSNNNLTSLIGSPEQVDKTFNCVNNKLTTLEGLPKYIGGIIILEYNQLTSIKGLSIYNLKKSIYRDWYIGLNPKIKEDYFDNMLEENPEIISLIDFELSTKFKDIWEHLLNAKKFDLI